MAKIEITNRYRAGAEKASVFLERNKRRLPAYRLTNLRTYNGVTIEVDDDDSEDMLAAIASAGFTCDSDDDSSDTSTYRQTRKI